MLRTTEVILDGAMHVSAAKNLVQKQEFLSAGRTAAPCVSCPSRDLTGHLLAPNIRIPEARLQGCSLRPQATSAGQNNNSS